MKDLDFDELDRAVNSLISNVPASTNTELPEKTLELESGPTEQLITAPVTSQPAVATSSPLVARRSTGRFMDVVPPSSNTRVSVGVPERVSRQGATISPTTPVTPDPVPPVVPVAPAPVYALTPVVETPAPTAPTTNTWPDPIDFKGLNLDGEAEKTVEPTTADTEDDDIDKISNEITDTLNQTTKEPTEQLESLDSPFISGTKVEKRPLGAFSDGQPTPEPVSAPAPVTPVAEPVPVEPVTQTMPVDTAPTSMITPFPAELSEDLLSIESGGATTQQIEPVAETPVAAAEPVAPTITVADNQPIVANSIAQQYTEQPSTGDQTSGAIYDTDAYHKALVTPAKKKSSWLWVLWIVILLAVGAGAGAAVYFLVLPQL